MCALESETAKPMEQLTYCAYCEEQYLCEFFRLDGHGCPWAESNYSEIPDN